MTRTVEIDLDLLKQLQDQEGHGIYLRLFQDGSGRVLTNAEDQMIVGSGFAPHQSPDDGIRRVIKPKPPTLLEDLDTVWVDHQTESTGVDAYARLRKYLEEQFECSEKRV